MAIFYNSINKAGKGIKKNVPKKKPFFLFWDIFFRKFVRMFQLNLIYIISLIPIVTFGPATAAFTYVLRNFSREEHAFVWMDYRDALKKHWKKGLIAGFLDAVIAYLMYYNFYFYSQLFKIKNQPIYLYIIFSITVMAFVIYLLMRPYIYIMIVTFKLKFREIYKNALIFAVVGLVRNIMATFGGLAIVYFFYWLGIKIVQYLAIPMEASLFFMVLILPVFVSFLSVFTAYPLIKKHMIDPLEAAKKNEKNAKKKKKIDDDDDPLFEDMT